MLCNSLTASPLQSEYSHTMATHFPEWEWAEHNVAWFGLLTCVSCAPVAVSPTLNMMFEISDSVQPFACNTAHAVVLLKKQLEARKAMHIYSHKLAPLLRFEMFFWPCCCSMQ